MTVLTSYAIETKIGDEWKFFNQSLRIFTRFFKFSRNPYDNNMPFDSVLGELCALNIMEVFPRKNKKKIPDDMNIETAKFLGIKTRKMVLDELMNPNRKPSPLTRLEINNWLSDLASLVELPSYYAVAYTLIEIIERYVDVNYDLLFNIGFSEKVLYLDTLASVLGCDQDHLRLIICFD